MREGKEEREKHQCMVASRVPPTRRPGQKPRHVPWLGMEPATLWFTGWHSIHWATPARAQFILNKWNNFLEIHSYLLRAYLCAGIVLSTGHIVVVILDFSLGTSTASLEIQISCALFSLFFDTEICGLSEPWPVRSLPLSFKIQAQAIKEVCGFLLLKGLDWYLWQWLLKQKGAIWEVT